MLANALKNDHMELFRHASRALSLTQGKTKMLACLGFFISVFNPVFADLLETDVQYETLVSGLNSPWSMRQLSDDEWVITERDGHLVFVNGKQITRVKLNLPDLYLAGQGGLLDVLPAPDYEESQRLFISYAKGSAAANYLTVGVFKREGESVTPFELVFQVNEAKNTPVHYAGRLVFLPDHSLVVSSGDGFDFREQAQVATNYMGKLLRIHQNGSIPSDNPFSLPDGSKSPVYSLGHRNPQGLVYVEDQKRLYSHEHGPAGGDELNIIEAGKNYGWPVITYGNDYSGARISPFREYPNMEQPLIDWTPSIAPSGMDYYGKNRVNGFTEIAGQLLVSTLVDKTVYAIDINQKIPIINAVFTKISERVRDVRVASDGSVFILTDGYDASLIVVKPARQLHNK